MKKPFFRSIILAITFCLFSSFGSSDSCDYVSSNMGYVRDETQQAMAKDDLNQTYFYTYRALKAIEKSKKELKTCGCLSAQKTIEEALNDLITATKATTLYDVRQLLNSALQNTLNSIETLKNHDTHYSEHSSKVDEAIATQEKTTFQRPMDMPAKKERIDQALVNYEKSLNNAIQTVDCKKARAFAQRIYDRCVQQLLIDGLSEEKKYYNLKTKEITENALNQLGNCTEAY